MISGTSIFDTYVAVPCACVHRMGSDMSIPPNTHFFGAMCHRTSRLRPRHTGLRSSLGQSTARCRFLVGLTTKEKSTMTRLVLQLWPAFKTTSFLSRINGVAILVAVFVLSFLVSSLFRQLPDHDVSLSRSKLENETNGTNEIYPRVWPSALADDYLLQFEQLRLMNRSGFDPELPLVQVSNGDRVKRHGKCKPYSDWHTLSFPTCHMFHEIDFVSGTDENVEREQDVQYLGSGGTSIGWVVQPSIRNLHNNSSGGAGDAVEAVVLRTVHWEVEFDQVHMDNQRKDALASERLTSSPHVIDIHGYCSEEAINEYAEGGNLKTYLKNLNDKLSAQQRLVFARDAAMGLADIHGVDGEGNLTTLVHHDLRSGNIMVSKGKLKYSDFNHAKFLTYDFEKNQSCLEEFDFHHSCISVGEREITPPEECTSDDKIQTEKFEVFRLGLLLYYLLTDIKPGHNGEVYLSNPPSFPDSISESQDPAVAALRNATLSALTYEADKRPSARSLAQYLSEAASHFQ